VLRISSQSWRLALFFQINIDFSLYFFADTVQTGK